MPIGQRDVLVHKFGGVCVGDAVNYPLIYNILRQYQASKQYIVVSAPSKNSKSSGVTSEYTHKVNLYVL